MQTQKLTQARALRREMTEPERLLWRHLRNRRLADAKFRRQQCFGPYILDFYCAEHKLCIEVDGGGHNQYDNRQTDRERDEYLLQQGVRTLRFWNQQVRKEMDWVLWKIKRELGVECEFQP